MANFRYRRDEPRSRSQPASMRLETGEHVSLERRIRDELIGEQNVWVILEDESDEAK